MILDQSWLQDGIFRDPESRSRGFGLGIFYFGLDQKILKIPKFRGSGFENSEKLPTEQSQKSRNLGDRDMKTSKQIPKISRPKFRKSRGSGSGFENPKNPEKIPKQESEPSLIEKIMKLRKVMKKSS